MNDRRMKTIFEAKKHLAARYRFEVGFVGVGIGRREGSKVLRVYVSDAHLPIVQQLKNDPTYEGFPVVVEVTGKIRAFSV